MKHLWWVAGVCWAAIILPLNAQNFEVGGFAGVAQYQGDLAEKHIELGETLLSKGFFMRYHLNEWVAFRAAYYNGNIAGDDANSPTNKFRAWKFSADINEFSFLTEVHALGLNRYDRRGKFRNAFTPTLFAGLAFSHADATLFVPEEDRDLFPEEGDTDFFLAVPFGAGMRYELSKYTSLGVEFGWRAIFSDYLDDVSKNGRRDKNDWYSFWGFTVSVVFGDSVLDFNNNY